MRTAWEILKGFAHLVLVLVTVGAIFFAWPVVILFLLQDDYDAPPHSL